MPGRDGTGPMGLGAGMGRNMGWCGDGNNTNRDGGSACFGAAFGRGCGRGKGRKAASEGSVENIKELLSEQKDILQRKIEIIDKRLENL